MKTTTSWKPGQTGNPQGRPRRGQSFTEALREVGTPEELAQLVWASARKGEPWAVQLLFNRLEPQPTQLQLTQETNNDDAIDYTRLTSEEISQLETLLERATHPAKEITTGESPP